MDNGNNAMGEESDNALNAGHSYTVMGTYLDDTGEEYIVLRNEWGESEDSSQKTLSILVRDLRTLLATDDKVGLVVNIAETNNSAPSIDLAQPNLPTKGEEDIVDEDIVDGQTDKLPFKSLLDGDKGLAFTFWFIGVCLGLILNTTGGMISFENTPVTAWIWLGSAILWSVTAWISIWNAANKYEGSLTWANLAKTSVILGVLRTVVEVFLV